MLKYRKISIEGGIYRYAYSRECSDFDGVVLINANTKSIVIEKPCKGDESDFAKNNTIEMTHAIIRNGYPEARTVMFY